ncbi:MAG: hypothetical protein ACYDDU_21490 [Dermatophilaceae bacterium]
MDEQELWTPADDETIRRALDTLRWETGALPLADVRFVKARGNSRRRRALVVGAAATAAAVAVVGVLGFNGLGRNQALDLSPAAPSTTPSLAAQHQRIGPQAVLVDVVDPVGTRDGIYGLEPAGDGPPYAGFYVIRVDPTTLKVTRSRLISGNPGGLTADASTLYTAATHTSAVLRFRVGDLLPLAAWRDPVASLLGPMAVTRSGLWVADAHGLTRLLGDLDQGGDSAQRWSAPPLMQTSYDGPDIGNEFWVVANDAHGCPALYAGTGPNGLEGHPTAVLHPTACELGFTALAAGPGVAWISTPSGSLASTALLTLNVVTTATWNITAGPHGSNEITPSVAGTISYISDPGTLYCLDDKGHLLATTTIAAQDGPVRIVRGGDHDFIIFSQGQIGTTHGPRIQPFSPASACH